MPGFCLLSPIHKIDSESCMSRLRLLNLTKDKQRQS